MEKYLEEFTSIIHKIYQFQRDSSSFLLKGEEGVLIYLNEDIDVTPTKISNVFKISTARVASLLNNLEKKLLIKRTTSALDKRKVYISLTETGVREAEELKEKYFDIFTNLFEKLGKEDVEKTIELLNKIYVIMKEGKNYVEITEN